MAYRCKYYSVTGKMNANKVEYIQCTSPTCKDSSLRVGNYTITGSWTQYCFNGGSAKVKKGKLFGPKEIVTERCPHYCY